MTILSVAQSACLRLVGKKPSSLFSSNGALEKQIIDIANEAAEEIAGATDWRVLTKQYTLNGDGSTASFPLPADYDRMVQGMDVTRPGLPGWRYQAASDLDTWTDAVNSAVGVSPGYWIIIDDVMHFQPAIPASEEAQFWYVSKNFVLTAGNTPANVFAADDDEFVLDDRLLTLSIIWRYRAQLRLDYAQEMENYEKRLSELSTRDRGARVIRKGGRSDAIWPIFGWGRL